jgi:hypothetical protein
MKRVDPIALRFELLKMRAATERADLRSAVRTLDASTRPARTIVTALLAATGRVRPRALGTLPLLGMVFGFARRQPWLLSAIVGFVLRRKTTRWVLLGGVAFAAAWLALRWRNRSAHLAAEFPPEPEPEPAYASASEAFPEAYVERR